MLGRVDPRGRGGGGVRVAREGRVEERGRESGHEREPGEHDRGGEETDGRIRPCRHGHAIAGRIPLGPERAPHEADAVRGREHGAERDAQQRHQAPHGAALGLVEERGDRALLRHEADRRDDTHHRADRDDRERREGRRLTTHPAQLGDVTGGELPVDHADHEEQARLEQRVPEQEGEPGERGIPRPVSEHHGEQAELAHRAEREDALQVGLAQRLDAAEQHREDAERDQHRPPWRGDGEHRGEPGDEVDARLDHGGGVQVRAHGGRRGHGAGEPEVEREDRGLAQRTDEHEHDGDVRHRPGGGVGEDAAEARRAGRDHEEHDADQHDETAEARDEQRLQCGAAARPAAVVVADEQVGQDAGDLPEHQQHDDVVGEHETVHRPGEPQEHRRELAESLGVAVEVPAAVEHHQGADPRHDERHHPSERVHPHRQVDAEARDPVVCLERNPSGQHRRGLQRGVHERDDRQHGRDRERACTEASDEPRQGEREDRERGKEDQHVRPPRGRRSISGAMRLGPSGCPPSLPGAERRSAPRPVRPCPRAGRPARRPPVENTDARRDTPPPARLHPARHRSRPRFDTQPVPPARVRPASTSPARGRVRRRAPDRRCSPRGNGR